MSAILGLHYKFRNLFSIEQEVGAKLNGIEWHSGFQPLMTFNGSALQGVLNDGRFAIDQWSSSFAPRHSLQAPSALGLVSVQRPTGANVILLRQKAKI